MPRDMIDRMLWRLLIIWMALLSMVAHLMLVTRKPKADVVPPYTLTGAVCTDTVPSGDPLRHLTPLCGPNVLPGVPQLTQSCSWQRNA
jgi:hypothetical protein